MTIKKSRKPVEPVPPNGNGHNGESLAEMSQSTHNRRTREAVAAAHDAGNVEAGRATLRRAVTIAPPNFQTAEFRIRGIAPYVQHKFSEKAREIMRKTQEGGSLAKRKGRVKEPKDFQAAYESAIHRSVEGWPGIPAVAFFKALVSACRMVDFKMTVARQGLYVHPDAWSADAADRSGLVKITKGKPVQFETLVRIQQTTDIRVRPLWEPGWEATVRVRHDADIFTIEDVSNLLMRAGQQVGVGEGRPDSPSGGQGWGLFEIIQKE